MNANRIWKFLAVFAILHGLCTLRASAQIPAGTVIHTRDGVLSTTIGTFTGGDPGEGLDLTGNFIHAVNFDEALANQQVGDALFVDVASSSLGMDGFGQEPPPGTFSPDHGGSPEYGNSANDNALEAVMASSHIGTGNAFNTMVLPGLVDGTTYKLQLLMNDPYNSVDREFDVRLPSVNAFPADAIIDNLSPQQHQGYFGPSAGNMIVGDWNLGVVVTVEFVQVGSDLNIGLDNYGQLSADGNYTVEAVIAGLTLEGGVVLPVATVFTWNQNDLGDWKTQSNWVATPPGPVSTDRANTPDHTVIFGDAATGPTTVVTNLPVTVNRIEFANSSNSYFIAGAGNVNLMPTTDTVPVDPSLSVQGVHRFQAPVNLHANATVDVAFSSTLVMDGALDLLGNTLTKTGGGELAIRNDLMTSGGTVDLQEGVISGSGTIGSDVNNGGTVSPGNSPGILTVDGNYTQNAGGTLALEIVGLTPGEQHDQLVVTGTADLNGTVLVELIDSFTPTANDQFDVLDFTTFVNSGYTFDFSSAMGAASWDTSLFETDGILRFGTGPLNTDFDGNGFWDLPDLNLVLFNWQQDKASLPVEWVNQRPAIVGLDSLNLVLFNWQQASSLAVVPEPAGLGLMALVSLFVCCRRLRV